MAQFRPQRVATEGALSRLPIREGQFIVVEATKELYFDKSASERIPVGSANSGTIIGWNDEEGVITDNAYTKTYIDEHFYTKDEIDAQIGDIETLMAAL